MQTMDLLANDYPEMILAQHEAPCLSLYQPTSRRHPENLQDPIRFRNLVRELTKSLQQKYPDREVGPMLEPLHDLAGDADFWNHSLDALAVLVAPDFFRVYRLQRPVDEFVVVADSFHTKPLVRIMQSADRYQILGLNRQTARLFEGNRDRLAEIDLASDVPHRADAFLDLDVERDRAIRTHGPVRVRPGAMGRHGSSDAKQDAIKSNTKRFFRAVDRGVLEHHSSPTGLPLLLAALPEHRHMFRDVSGNPNLLAESIDVHPDDIALDELRRLAWEQVQPYYLKRLAGLIDRFHAANYREQATDDLAEAAQAVIGGRIDTLLLDAGRHVPGRMDATTGEIILGELDDPQVGDLLDDLGERVLVKSGEVIVVPTERMPTDTGLAAIYRY
jgi:hypothetical protein